MADTQYCCCCCCFLRQLLFVFLLFPTLIDAAENCSFTSVVNVTSKEIVLTCQCPEGRVDGYGFPVSRGEPPAVHMIRIQASGAGIGFRLTPVANPSPTLPSNKWTTQNTFKYSYNQSSIPVVNTGHLRFACRTEGMRYSHEIVNTVYKLTVNLLDYYTSAPTTTTTTTVPPITTTVTTSTKTQRPTATITTTTTTATADKTTTAAANKTKTTTTAATSTAADKTTATNKTTATTTTFADFKLWAADVFAPKIVEAVTEVKYKSSNTLMGRENADAEIEMLRIPIKTLIFVGVCAVLFFLVIGLIIFILAKRHKRRRRKRKSRNLSMTEMGLPPISPPPVCSRNADGKEQLAIDRLLTQFPSSHQQGYRLIISQENIYDEARSEDGSSSADSTYAECDLPTAFQQTYRDDGEPTERLHEFSHQTDGHSHPQADFTEENDGYLVPQADFTEENDGYLVPQADFTEGDDGYLVPQADFTEGDDGYLVPQAPCFSEATRQQVRDNHLENEAHQDPLYDDAEEASHHTKLTSHCAEVASHYDELRKVSHRDNAEDAYSLYDVIVR